MRHRLPPTFLLDHIARGLLPEDAIVKETRRYVEVEIDGAQVSELLSDARHYADTSSGYGAEYRGLAASARSTVRRLTAATLSGDTSTSEGE